MRAFFMVLALVILRTHFPDIVLPEDTAVQTVVFLSVGFLMGFAQDVKEIFK